MSTLFKKLRLINPGSAVQELLPDKSEHYIVQTFFKLSLRCSVGVMHVIVFSKVAGALHRSNDIYLNSL